MYISENITLTDMSLALEQSLSDLGELAVNPCYGEDTAIRGYAYHVSFPNGLVASIVKHEESVGSHSDLWEIAIFKDGGVWYKGNPVLDPTEGVMGYLDEFEVYDLCKQIRDIKFIRIPRSLARRKR